jgi:sphinganine-1-phosphate aldolase
MDASYPRKLIDRLGPRFVSAVKKVVGKLNPRLIAAVEKRVKSIPLVSEMLEKEYDSVLAALEESVKPYRGDFESYSRLPEVGLGRDVVLERMAELSSREESRWKDGLVSGAVYHGDDEHTGFLSQVYAVNSQSNPLHSDIWPSAAKYEAEVVAMTAAMLCAEEVAENSPPENRVCGAVSSGGTESIMLAVKAYRDRARDVKGITKPEMVVPSTAHAAFDKASQYFNVKMVRVPVGPDFRADPGKTEKAITRNTVLVAGSAPDFPHGLVDPIEELSELARERGIGFHTDACLGGFILPFARKLGYDVPPFDFRLPGVTSMSADTHKYGYAAKGTSVVLYRGLELRRYQYYTTSDWPGGLYFSPTFAGSRSGALSAMCWAAMLSVGERGYLEASAKVLRAAAAVKEAVRATGELYVLGDPLFCVAFSSASLDIYKVMDFMTGRGWNLNGLLAPPAVHICVTLRHTQPGVVDKCARDLADAVAHVKRNPDEKGGLAPIYGLAATVPLKGIMRDVLARYMDLLYKV